MRLSRCVSLGVLGSMIMLAASAAFADPYATVAEPPAAFVEDPTCELENPLFPAPVPTAEDVPIPVFPDAIFAGATSSYDATANDVSYQALPSVRLLTRSVPEDVVAFYGEQLGDQWAFFELSGIHTYYLHEPVDQPIMLLLERPGAIPSVEIGEITLDCDAKLDPSAVSYVTTLYPVR